MPRGPAPDNKPGETAAHPKSERTQKASAPERRHPQNEPEHKSAPRPSGGFGSGRGARLPVGGEGYLKEAKAFWKTSADCSIEEQVGWAEFDAPPSHALSRVADHIDRPPSPFSLAKATS